MKTIFEFDPSRCSACGACSVACMDQNDRSPERGEEPYRKCFTSEEGHGEQVKLNFLTKGCMHCEEAACIDACPVSCFWKDEETGLVVYDNTACVGCRLCLEACPYDAPVFDDSDRMSKCDGCIERVRIGFEPACIRVCPFDAITMKR